MSKIAKKTLTVLFVLFLMPVGVFGAEKQGMEPLCSPNVDGLKLPPGFCAQVVADGVGRARHLAVAQNGNIYVRLSRWGFGGSLVALRDNTGNGRADEIERFCNLGGGTGVGLQNNYLYFSTNGAILRYPLKSGQLVLEGSPERVVDDFPVQFQHGAKSFVLDGRGHLFVNVGAPSNACQEVVRSRGSPGQYPCPQRKYQAAIWRFDAGRLNQHQADGEPYAVGIRNAVALAWNPLTQSLFAAVHGRDQLHSLWPHLYSISQNAELPAEEFVQVDKDDDFGWPYCYYDQNLEKKVLAPEYGGDGKKTGFCSEYKKPIIGFPGHWAPNGLLFYTGKQFPKRFHGGAFIAFHGSWNRAPLEQQGYKVVFVPFDGERSAGGWEDFATGFAGPGKIRSSGDARYRPMGLAQGADGSLLISDSVKGRIWRVTYRGDK